jgi:hypothetical protein
MNTVAEISDEHLQATPLQSSGKRRFDTIAGTRPSPLASKRRLTDAFDPDLQGFSTPGCAANSER